MSALELFAGAGGAALGLRRAGFSALAHVEWDSDACATLRAAVTDGLLDGEVIEGDVRAVDYAPFVGRVDLLWASPPCQAFSSAGKRLGASDERNGWPWTFDVIDAVKPTWFLAENVPGLTHLAGGCEDKRSLDCCPGHYFFRTILPEIARRFPWSGWTELDAADLGVPQHRRRIFIGGGPRPLRWPEPTHADPATLRQGALFGPKLSPYLTVRQALNLAAALRPERGAGMVARHGPRRDHPPDEPAPQIGAGSAGSGPRLQMVPDGRDELAESCAWSVSWAEHAERGAPGGSSQPFLTTSRTGRKRIEYTLNDQKIHRGPSDAVRRHSVDSEDGPAATIGALRPSFLLDPRHPPCTPDAPATSIRSGGDGHAAPPLWLRTEMTGAVAATVDEPAATVPHAGNQYLHAADPGVRRGSPLASSRPELLDAPPPAVLSREGKGTTVTPTTGARRASDVQCATDVVYLGAGIRRLTPAECAKLQDFPDGYPFQGTKTSIYRQIGNAVCSSVAHHLGRAIIEAGE